MMRDTFLTITETFAEKEQLPTIHNEELDTELFSHKLRDYPGLITMGPKLEALKGFDFTMLNQNLRTLKISRVHLKLEADIRRMKALLRGAKINTNRDIIVARFVDRKNRIDITDNTSDISLKHELIHAASSRTAGLNTNWGISMVGSSIRCQSDILTDAANSMGRELCWGYELNELYTDYLLSQKLQEERFQLSGISSLMQQLERLFEGKLITWYSQGEAFKINNYLINNLTIEELRALNILLKHYHHINQITKNDKYITKEHVDFFNKQTGELSDLVAEDIAIARLRKARNQANNN